MEGVGAFVGEEWASLNRMISIEDSVDLPLMINANYIDEIPSSIFSWPNNHDDQSLYNFPSFSDILVSSTSNTDIFNGNGNENYDDSYGGYVHNATDYNTLNVDDQFMNNNLHVPGLQVCGDDQLCIINDQMQLKRKYNETVPDDETNHLSQSPKKRSRVSKEKNKRKAESTTKKKKKITSMINNEQENNSSHEDESNGSEGSPSESKDDSVTNSTPNSKLGNKRGSATDPQSLYARRRREKINERLRILQNLVPNGTKVDISTMLEEAVHYVKFLQLQIKLLSSDDMWMYAPIAHSGMDMGLYQKIFLNLPC